MKNKVTLSMIIAVFVIVLALYAGVQKAAAADQTGLVTASTLNVRTGAGTNYAIMQQDGKNVTLSNGTKVIIVETLTGWYKVEFVFNGQTLTGYVSSAYVAREILAATPTPDVTQTPSPTQTVYYRTETTYQNISVKAKISGSAPVYKSNGKTRYKVKKTHVSLKKGKKVTILGEKTIAGKKWFRVKFTYKKKKRTAYVRSTYVKMTLKKSANAQVVNVKKNLKIRKKKGSGSPYKKSGDKIVRIAKGSVVSITKEALVKKTKWYKISYVYAEKKMTGYANAKYIKLAKKISYKKVPVIALSDAQFEQMLKQQAFPESYKQSLRLLHQKYPYWQFQAYQTGLDWNTAVSCESKTGVNLISNAKGRAWKSTMADAYDESEDKWKVFDGSSWVAASQGAVAYYMDPRNFLNDKTIYMFELLGYQPQYQSKDGVNTILSNTPFYKKTFTYKNLINGADVSIYYVDAFMHAAQNAKVSPYHLASRVKQEVVTGPSTTSTAVTGTVPSYPGIYNFYNIGATSSSQPVLNGLKWASDTKSGTYLRPWTDPYRSIVGGAQYISQGYISKGQNTGYLEKFNVTSYKRYDHQYMTNVEAAYQEAIKTKKAYAGMMDKSPLVFVIPVYNNMPETAAAIPQ